MEEQTTKKRSLWESTPFCALVLTLCAVAWGSGYLFNKMSIEEAGMSPEAILFARELISAICCFAIFHKRIKNNYKKGDWKGGLIASAFFVAATLFQTYGLTNTSPGVAAFLTSTYVVIVPLLWWAIRKEKPSKTIAICAVCALVGIGFLSLTDGFHMHAGDILVLICAFGFSGYNISILIFARDMDEIVFAALLFAFCTVMSFVVFIVNDGNWAQFFTVPAIISILYLSLVYTFISNTAQVFAMGHISAGLAAILLGLESLFGALFGIIGGYDTITVRFVIGGVLMMIAVLLPTIDDYKKEQAALAAEESAEEKAEA